MRTKFITPCFVHIEDKAYREKVLRELDELGYACACVGYSNDAIVSTHNADYSVDYRPVQSDTVDCGTNIDLFLALAGMRSDTDKGQWFVVDEPISIGTQILSIGAMFNLAEGKFNNSIKARRATAQEIVEHFKNKTK